MEHAVQDDLYEIGSLTKDAKDKEKGLVCPNCGAPLTGTSFGKCEYCGSIVTTGAYDWVLSAFTAIKKYKAARTGCQYLFVVFPS